MFNLETADGNNSYDENKKHHHSHCSSLQDQTVLWIGVAIVCLALVGLMLTFCPESKSDTSNAARSTCTKPSAFCCCCRVDRRSVLPLPENNGEVSEPLLPNDEFAYDDDINAHEEGLRYTSTDANESQPDEEAASSRLRGTSRLLKLAGSESMYLWLGIVVLLIRLPFSLSIPNFVSAVIGDLINADYDGAKRNVLLLFLLGSVDSVLDFWW